jgi:hypothetical protein
MKKLYLSVILIFFISSFVNAQQWIPTGNDIFNYNTGNVGVGTGNLTAKFTVYESLPLGSAAKSTRLLTSVSGFTNGNIVQNNIWLVRNTAGMDFITSRVHDAIAIDTSFGIPQVNTRTWWERDPTQDVQSWGTAATTYFTIKQGFVGIGTTSPQEALSVNGNIRAKQVKVEIANWPDYVFAKEYYLPSLQAVKIYIEQNQHLPEVPSEQEMAREGLNVGEMNKLLMKKVEELTLYMIEKDKEIKNQNSRINDLEYKYKNILATRTKKTNNTVFTHKTNKAQERINNCN